MISRLRSAGNKTNQERNSFFSKPRPSKEDILNTIDGFSGNLENGAASPDVAEDNNNLTRHSSKDSVNSEPWEIPNIQPMSASFTNAYSGEWEKLFSKPNYKKILKHYAMSGYLRSSRFRSVSWKVFLEVLPDDVNLWVSKTRAWRNKFEDLKNSLIVNPRKAVDHSIDLAVNNPLSQSDESPWNLFFQDNELRLTIKQDVIRTFPEVQFFQSEVIQEKMIDLLFIVCKTMSTISYKQGMHELLAPLIFVLHCDHQAFLHASEVESLGEVVKEVMDPSYLEHDAYAMLSQIMDTVEPWYVSKDTPQCRAKEKITTMPFARPQDLNPSNVIVSKLTRIQDYILKKFDVELHMHLDRLEIPPQIYGIRWIRLLFGREFPMQDLLVLWDALFADGIGFDLVDYVFVAMLLYIRDLLLASDYPQCLNCLMRYPPVGDVHYLIEKARYLRDPNSHPRPPNYTYQNINIVKTAPAPKKRTPQYQKQKRGSSASLSQVEDGYFKSGNSTPSTSRIETSGNSASATARMESSYRQTTTGYSPSSFTSDEGTGNMSKFATLPNPKGKGKKENKEKEYEFQIGTLQNQISDKESMCEYASQKLDIHIDRLQSELLQQDLHNEDEILIAIAGIKQVRDVLKGTLRFSKNLLAEDPDMKMSEDLNFSPETDISADQTNDQKDNDDPRTKMKQYCKIFYMSSEENSEAADSPTDFIPSSGIPEANLELRHYTETYRYGNEANINNKTIHVQSEATKVDKAKTVKRGGTHIQNCPHPLGKPTERSPNPLYCSDSSEDSA